MCKTNLFRSHEWNSTSFSHIITLKHFYTSERWHTHLLVELHDVIFLDVSLGSRVQIRHVDGFFRTYKSWAQVLREGFVQSQRLRYLDISNDIRIWRGKHVLKPTLYWLKYIKIIKLHQQNVSTILRLQIRINNFMKKFNIMCVCVCVCVCVRTRGRNKDVLANIYSMISLIYMIMANF